MKALHSFKTSVSNNPVIQFNNPEYINALETSNPSDILDAGEGSNNVFRNSCNHLPNNKESYSRRLEFSPRTLETSDVALSRLPSPPNPSS
jgi:hypothetical protein